MDSQKKTCSFKDHGEIEAVIYCSKCAKFICKKCELFHSYFFDTDHKLFIIDSNNFDNIKTTTQTPGNELDSITIEEKTKYLTEFSKKLNEINNKLKNELEKMNKNKEDLKIKIQNMFTKLRNTINKTEDDILSEIDLRFEKSQLNEDIKMNESFLNKIKLILNKDPNQYDLLLNECKTFENKNIDIEDYDAPVEMEMPEDKEIDNILETIKNLYSPKKVILNTSIDKIDIKNQNLLNTWIREKLGHSIKKYTLIYKLTKNGSNPSDFHKYCDNKSPTLTIIQTKNNEIFGGFTTLNWNYDTYDRNVNTFIFSLNLKKKYEMFNSEKEAIISNKEFGPTFGHYDIMFKGDLYRGFVRADQESNFFEYRKLELLNVQKEYCAFDVKEIEIFQVE